MNNQRSQEWGDLSDFHSPGQNGPILMEGIKSDTHPTNEGGETELPGRKTLVQGWLSYEQRDEGEKEKDSYHIAVINRPHSHSVLSNGVFL